jgi:hypothetical protein
MGRTINLHTEYSPKVAERISKGSVTSGVASTDYKFVGVKTVEVSSVDVVALSNYNINATGDRYGTAGELGDTIQALTISQDKSFTYTIDKGNNDMQHNIKAANATLKREIDEVIVPTLDKYRLEQWSRKAGAVASLNAVNSNSITSLIMDCTEKLDNNLVPETGRVMYITATNYKALKQNPNFIYAGDLVKESLIKGQVGEIDGMKVVKVPKSYLPTGVEWFIAYKGALLAPEKLMDYKIHQDPVGISGNKVEGRIIHDAFVLGAKGNAILVGINSSYAINTPTLTWDNTNTNANIASTTTGVDLWYTTDGSDPRYSNSATKVGANTGKISFDTLNNAATDSNGKTNVKLAAVPNSNTSFFWSEVSNVYTYA